MARVRPWLCILVVLCAVMAPWTALAGEPEAKEAKGADDGEPPIPLSWVAESRSPQSASIAGRDAHLHALCGARDLGLGRVASAILSRRLSGAPAPSPRAIEVLARAAGVPHPFVAAWSLAGTVEEPALDPAVAKAKLGQWLAKQPAQGSRRCGLARGADRSGAEVVVVVTADALADLKAFPTKSKVSTWLKLDARVHPDAESAKVVLLGPKGRPKRVLASLDKGLCRSRFALDQPGRWIVQVVAALPTGPRPVLEVEVYAGLEPPTELIDEQPDATPKHDARDLFTWLNKERQQEGLPLLKRNPTLDALARKHAIAMVHKNLVAHDVGKGTPRERVATAGVGAMRVGENVARAATVRRVHAALWDSPSHRENMLDASFRHVGLAAVKDDRGRVWSVQVFTDRVLAPRP